MRIIVKSKKERIKKCWNCGSIFAYEPEDIENDLWLGRTLKCPVCKRYVSPSIFDKKVKI